MTKANLLICTLIIISSALAITACSDQQQTSDANTVNEPTPEEVVKQGEYLVEIMGCNDCHSPKKMGPQGPEIISELMLSGYPADRPIIAFKDSLIKQGFAQFYPDLTAAAGPWGVSFAGNLTPDETGLGDWTEEQFKRALTKGMYKGLEGGRMMLPPMPWQNYRNMKDEDIHAMFMYLKSIQPVSNIVPAHVPPDAM